MAVQAGIQSSVAILIRLFVVCWTVHNADGVRTTVHSVEFSSMGRSTVGPPSDYHLTTFMNPFIPSSFIPISPISRSPISMSFLAI